VTTDISTCTISTTGHLRYHTIILALRGGLELADARSALLKVETRCS